MIPFVILKWAQSMDGFISRTGGNDKKGSLQLDNWRKKSAICSRATSQNRLFLLEKTLHLLIIHH